MSTTTYEPAFPVVSEIMGHSAGMSLRDYFAAQAMAPLIAAALSKEDLSGQDARELVATAAYGFASSMLEERSRG